MTLKDRSRGVSVNARELTATGKPTNGIATEVRQAGSQYVAQPCDTTRNDILRQLTNL